MPALAGITVERHVLRPDGAVELVLRVDDADAEILAAAGGTVTDLGDQGARVTWAWGPGIAPADAVGTCTAHLVAVLQDWARGEWGGPIDLTA